MRDLDKPHTSFDQAATEQTTLTEFATIKVPQIRWLFTNLEGASLLGAKLSGTYFPTELSAQEIRLSLDTGTRLRYSRD